MTSSLNLSYLEWNFGETPVLLLHGLGDECSIWTGFAQYLGKPFHCLAPDLRNPIGGVYNCSEIITGLETLLDHLHWRSAHVVAHSWGGKIATIWATQSPHWFSSLTLVDPVCGLTQPLSIPSLFIQPEQGLNRTSLHLRPYKVYCQNLLIKTMPGDHWPFLSHPAIFNPIVKDFLSRKSCYNPSQNYEEQ